MKTIASYSLVSVFIFAGLALAAAQEATDTVPPPKVLAVFREFVKPGIGGSLHEKPESGFVQAYARAKWPQHYFTVNSLTGKPRAFFLIGYPTFEAWHKDNQAQQKKPDLSAAIDPAVIADVQLPREAE